MLTACLAALLASVSCASPSVPAPSRAGDPRTAYDVTRYELELAVDPETETLEGAVEVRAALLDPELADFVLDLADELEVLEVSLGDKPTEWSRGEDSLLVSLPPAEREAVAVRVRYRGQPRAENAFDGFHWEETEDGRPWIGTSCQGSGAHSWWPCKASYFHPDDKPEGVETRLTVPAGLTGVSNGRLVEIVEDAPGWLEWPGEWRTFHWRHDYPLETYTVTLNVAPYVAVETELELPGVEGPVPFTYYVLPESAEKAAVQFAQVPELIEVFSRAFGPWPFPDSKIGLVETSFWGMEHSTAVAYGSSFPAWCRANGVEDPYAPRNRFFDYILVHEMAHEWWGNAVSAEHWGHFWIHEGFGTYAEAVWIELTEGRERADEYFELSRRRIGQDSVLYRGDRPASGDAYAGVIYSKGAWVLNTLRHYVADDEAWWGTLRAFQRRHRYGNATTEDFRAVLEELTGQSWERFFEEWVYGSGTPELVGTVRSVGSRVAVDVANERGTFHVPLDLAGTAGGTAFRRRVWLEPGAKACVVELGGAVTELAVVDLHRVLGAHDVVVAGG